MDANASLTPPGFEKRFVSFVGKLGLIISTLLFPPVFSYLFSVSSLVLNESFYLWFFSILLAVISLLLVLLPKKVNTSISFVFFIILFFILIELITRTCLGLFYTEVERLELGNYSNKTYEEFAKYKGHPFLGYTGNPGINYYEKGRLKRTTTFNNMGFVGNDFSYKKPNNTIRVACVGGSTTERGYPAITEYQLNKFFNNSLKFEVLNFGVSGWTTANSLVNFILNVREFKPDYLIIHHGWNEDLIRNTPKNLFRSDYSHALKYFHEPEIIDKIPIRISILYRILKINLSNTPDWVFLGDATTKSNRKKTNKTYENVDELIPFKRNVKTITDLCLQNRTKVILSTQPFSLSNKKNTSKTIEQANKIIRELHKTYNNQTSILDLDEIVTGNLDDVFIDLAHMNEKGTFFKGTEFSRIIINDILGKDSVKTTLPISIESISFHNYAKNTLSNQKKKKHLVKKAKERGITPYQMLKRDALYIFNIKNPSPKINNTFEYCFQEYKILNSPEWTENIKKQALERNISFEENLKRNVEYVLKNRLF